jgi:hypothetical protein
MPFYFPTIRGSATVLVMLLREVHLLMRAQPHLTFEHKMSPCVGHLVFGVLSGVILSHDCTSRGLFELSQHLFWLTAFHRDQQLRMDFLP